MNVKAVPLSPENACLIGDIVASSCERLALSTSAYVIASDELYVTERHAVCRGEDYHSGIQRDVYAGKCVLG